MMKAKVKSKKSKVKMVNCNAFYVANTRITIQLRCVTHLCALPIAQQCGAILLIFLTLCGGLANPGVQNP